MDDITVVDECVTDEGESVSRYDSAYFEAKAGRFQHVDDGDTDQEPNSRSCTISLLHALKGNLDTTVRCWRIAIGSSDIVFDFCKGAEHH